jgi:hypothetical protein
MFNVKLIVNLMQPSQQKHSSHDGYLGDQGRKFSRWMGRVWSRLSPFPLPTTGELQPSPLLSTRDLY